MLQSVKNIQFKILGDDRGQLIALEALSAFVPFEVKRVYYIYGTLQGTVRGKHSHKKLRQLLICVNGTCTIRCDFGGGKIINYELKHPEQGLLIEGMVWHEMLNFSQGSVLLVLASDHYEEEDYIRDYCDFSRILKEG